MRRKTFPTCDLPEASKCVSGSSRTNSDGRKCPRRATKSEKPKLRESEHRLHCPPDNDDSGRSNHSPSGPLTPAEREIRSPEFNTRSSF
mmetsp:Transcript_11737/g.17098  ORF Transcript_11737/g.17098 Transcript_11737/m.17098 type:complete len:89 (-) Transcript_11737:773-1039(-)